MRTILRVSPRLLVPILSLWFVSGCAALPKQVASVARQDLDCPNAQVGKLADDRYAASGCGRGAVYVRVCDGAGCRWGRLRHGHEASLAAQSVNPPVAVTREVLPAPAPEAREIQPAPPPAARQVLPAPPPADVQSGSATPQPPATTGEAPATAPSATTPAPVPLSQGDLSEPYETTAPERPAVQQVAYAPPQPLVDDRPPPPAPSYIWVSGYWWWGMERWVWLPGYWCAPVVGYAYNPGYWYWSASYWWYWPGGWSVPGTTTIVVQTAPRSQRIVRVRSFTPRTAVQVAGGQSSGSTSVVRALPVASGVSASAGNRVVRAAPAATFRPQSSPMLRYPTAVRTTVSASPGVRDRMTFSQSSTVGRVVRPGVSIPRPTRFDGARSRITSLPSSSSSGASSPRPSVSRSVSTRSSARMLAPQRTMPIRAAPAVRPTRFGPSRR